MSSLASRSWPIQLTPVECKASIYTNFSWIFIEELVIGIVHSCIGIGLWWWVYVSALHAMVRLAVVDTFYENRELQGTIIQDGIAWHEMERWTNFEWPRNEKNIAYISLNIIIDLCTSYIVSLVTHNHEVSNWKVATAWRVMRFYETSNSYEKQQQNKENSWWRVWVDVVCTSNIKWFVCDMHLSCDALW